MSIAKLFVKVFGEDLFEEPDEGKDEKRAEVRYEFEEAAPSTAVGGTAADVHSKVVKAEIPLTEQVSEVKDWLQRRLGDIEENLQPMLEQQRELMSARLGPDLAIFSIEYSSAVRMSNDRLSARSQGSFNTIRANVCVHAGRWMYEVYLHSKGVMQVGWCSNKCVFNENSGVGDTKMSYGFDGSKQQTWHISTKKYGEKWQIGDVIGVIIDVDKGLIEFLRNGKPLGIAFDTLEKGPGITFYPAMSLGYNQAVQANFGNLPFKYPVQGYQPLQEQPLVALESADLLLSYLVNLATIVSRSALCKDKKPRETKVSTKKTIYMLFCSLLMERLAKYIFDPYVINEKLVKYISSMSVESSDSDTSLDISPGMDDSVLGSFLSLFWNFFEGDEIRYLLKKLTNALLLSYTHTHKGLDYEKQRMSIYLLTCVCQHQRSRKALLQLKFFKKHCLALFLYLRPPDYPYMLELVPNSHAWTEGVGGPKQKYLATVEKISKSTEGLYQLHKSLLLILLNNTDGDATSPSSRKIFLVKLRRYITDLSMEQRALHSFFLMQSSIQHPIESQVALAFQCILLDVTKTISERELDAHGRQWMEINPQSFYDGSFEYQNFDRLGGVMSHLRKMFRGEIQTELGAERTQNLMEDQRSGVRIGEIAANMDNLSVVGRNFVSNPVTTFTQLFNPRVNPAVDATPGNMDTQASISELLDISVLFYYGVGHKYIVKVASVRDEIATLNEVLRETHFYREDVVRKLKVLEDHASVCMNESHTHIVSELKSKFSQRENVFAKRSIDLARKQSWYRAVALGRQRRDLIIWLLEKTLKTLEASSKSGALFAFAPEVYINVLPILLDTVMDFSYHDLHVQFEIADAECVINSSAEFLSMHSADPRIILASCKDSLLQALGTLTCHKSGIRALERATKKSQITLAKALLRPYENRAWGQSNWLLLRFWMGEGFAYREARQPSVWQGGNEPVQIGICRSRDRNEQHTGLLHHVAPPNPSKHFQKLIGNKLLEDEPFATTFLNSVLSQLNWAFSEFILLLQEIQNTAQRRENTVFEPKQLKICSMCFELTVSLMRCLEMIISMAPDIFKDSSRPNGDLILNRICQLISQVLSRVTVPPGCFQFVVDLCSADLNTVTHFPIITAALGILLALMRSEMDSEKSPAKVTRLTRALLTDQSFQFANLEFALGEIRTPILQQAEIPRGNFDPQSRAHIDPLTNAVRVPMPTSTTKRIRADPPVIKFSLSDYPTHVTAQEIEDVRRLIEMLRVKQSLLSDITLPSEDSLCPICCAKPITVTFTPCKHQSCSNCILQHLMNSKLCFYCKTLIETIEDADGAVIYKSTDFIPSPRMFEQM